MEPFKVYDLHFDKYIYPCNEHTIKIDFLCYPKKFLSCPLHSFLPISTPRKPLICCHNRLALPFLEFLVNGLIQDIYSSFISILCLRVIHCYCLYISSLLLFNCWGVYLSSVTLCGYKRVCLSTHLLVNIWIVSNFWLLWIKLLWTWWGSVGKLTFSFDLGEHLEVEWLHHTIGSVCLAFKETAKLSCKWWHYFTCCLALY